jgi:hypothetical protein
MDSVTHEFGEPEMHWIDPESLSPMKSKIARFLFNPKGDADGMLLANGTEAHFPPHLSKKVLESVQLGEAVTLYGVKPRAADMIACVAIQSARGERIDDTGPPDNGKKKIRAKNSGDADDTGLRRVEIEDTVERKLHGPKGEVRGLLLSNGCIVRFPPHAAHGARTFLTSGAVIAVRGEARTVSGTQVIEVRAWGKSKAHLNPLAPKKPHG